MVERRQPQRPDDMGGTEHLAERQSEKSARHPGTDDERCQASEAGE